MPQDLLHHLDVLPVRLEQRTRFAPIKMNAGFAHGLRRWCGRSNGRGPGCDDCQIRAILRSEMPNVFRKGGM